MGTIIKEYAKVISRRKGYCSNINSLLDESGIMQNATKSTDELIYSEIRDLYETLKNTKKREDIVEILMQLVTNEQSIVNAAIAETNDKIESAKIKDVISKIERKSERRDTWLLWSQKIIRWFLGIFTAILIYSTFVYLSDDGKGFWKMPGKDTIEKFAPKT